MARGKSSCSRSELGNCPRLWRGLHTIWPLVRADVKWNVNNSIVDQIAAIPPPRDSYGEDRLCWRLENNQKFSIKSAYASSHPTSGYDDTFDWSLIWRLKIPQQVWIFLWLVLHNKLLKASGYAMLQPPGFSVGHESGWLRPEKGWVKGNIDGVVDLHTNSASCGGVLRDSNDDWCMGFYRSLGRCFVIMAEMWVVHDMLKQVWSLRYQRVEVETDNSEVHEIISSKSMTLHGNSVV
ncbi:hypothetical protein V6N12_053243 [Hibiscus sabdariffa]|uniref:Reverse transcriptase zinc-binding domain-containing protein n=1 Tax=Hibiscus sabdariffa TaxID=183260 RepID=A0ABR2D6Z8_9ROSI